MLHTLIALLLTAVAFVAARPADLRCSSAHWAAVGSPMPTSIAAHCVAMEQPPLPMERLRLHEERDVEPAPTHDPWLGYVGEPIETRLSFPVTTRSIPPMTAVAPAPAWSVSAPLPTGALPAKRANGLESAVFVPSQDNCLRDVEHGSYECAGNLMSPDYRHRIDELFFVPSDIAVVSAEWMHHSWGQPYDFTHPGVTTATTTITRRLSPASTTTPRKTLAGRAAAPADAPITMAASGGPWYSKFDTLMELFFTTTDVDGHSKITRVHVSENEDGSFRTLTNKRPAPTTTNTTTVVLELVTMTTTIAKGE